MCDHLFCHLFANDMNVEESGDQKKEIIGAWLNTRTFGIEKTSDTLPKKEKAKVNLTGIEYQETK